MATKKSAPASTGAKRGRKPGQTAEPINPIIQFEDIPPRVSASRRSKWDDTLDALSKKPNKAARIAECGSAGSAAGLAATLRRLTSKREGTWEIAARNTYVYAVFKGSK